MQIAGFQVRLLMKGTSLEELSAFAKAMRANCVPLRPWVDEELMDTTNAVGGSGAVDLTLYCQVWSAVRCPVILAGGITAEKCVPLLRNVGPELIDVMTGVESFPDRKGARKLKAIVEAVRNNG